MPGMSSGLNATNPTIVAAFGALLAREGAVVLALFIVLFLVWRALSLVARWRVAAGSTASAPALMTIATTRAGDAWPLPEAVGRRVLRIGFGLLWILDGLLQAQAAMPLGMGPDVIQPAVSGSPLWLQHLVNAGVTVWTFHPIEAAAAAVWIQIGIGLWLLVSPRGRWSRAAGAVSVGWGLCVWIFGEALGGILAPGASFLFGAPGAVLFYAFAGVAIALPERAWVGRRLGRIYLSLMGAFFLAMAALQALPGGGFWVGHLVHGHQSDGSRLGTLADMVHQMSSTPQPQILSAALTAFARFDAAHGFGVNLAVVISLAGLGLLLLSGRPRAVRLALGGAVVLNVATWVFVQDLGFLGGVGTDPNSMVPILVVLFGAERALDRSLVAAATPLAAGEANRLTLASARGRLRALVGRLVATPRDALRIFAALATVCVVLLGAVPMAVAALNPTADPIIAQAVDGVPDAVDFPAPAFRLEDQLQRAVSLSGLRGKTVAVTFLDPVCTSACPIIAQEFRQADALLSSTERQRVELLAIDANPRYLSSAYLLAFDRQESLGGLRNWHFLTGTLPQLRHLWTAFGVQVEYSPGGAMVAHSELTYVIDKHGHIRWALDTNTGPETSASKSSFAATLVADLRQTMAGS